MSDVQCANYGENGAMADTHMIRIKREFVKTLNDHKHDIENLFGVHLNELVTTSTGPPLDVVFEVHNTAGVTCIDPDLVSRLQSYVDSTSWCISNNDSGGVDDSGGVLGGGEEDSSYDSDGPDAGDSTGHPSASRTTSDTLAAEYAEYVQQYHHHQQQQIPGGTSTSPTSPGYAARVEFALKLGYTERLVQAALQKLGPSPGNNELLAELIKLGARAGPLDPATPPASPPAGAAPGDDANVPDAGALYDDGGVNVPTAGKLRSIVIDGSNVAMSHGNKEVFSCRGIKICVDWFRSRGHREITVFVPKWRKESPRPDNPITGQDILNELEKERLLVYTPSRLIGGKRMVCYDDRYILRLAAETDGIVVSNDNYRDLAQETPEYRRVVEERILMYSFVNDRFMPPDDPLGRAGPTLDNFLRAQPRPPPLCPYGKKCTYGNKCKFHHPERGPLPHKTVTERLSEHAQRHYLQASTRLQGKSLSLPLPQSDDARKTPLSRTRSNVPTVSETAPVNESVNLHRKLQRQLSLNPGGDSRLYGLKCYPGPPPAYNNAMLGNVQHRPLGRHSSAGSRVTTPSATASAWDLHQHVTRIASAPGPPPTIVQRPMHRMSSASDPQINLCAPNPNQSWPKCYMQPHVLAQHYASSTEDARRRLHYHLAAIFPEEQVTQVMNLYPDETNAQKICAAILSMFPKA